MSPDEVLAVAAAGRALGCKEALFTLGDRPEARYESHRRALRRFGHETTQSYLAAMCRLVLEETGLLPHPNAGVLGRRELAELREVSASQGMMLESVAERLCGPGGPHEGAPDKRPRTRLAMIARAGELAIPFTSGILIGIGETPAERVEALLALRDLHDEGGHIQEVIVQNFRAKPDTPMAAAGEPGLARADDRTCAIARLVLGPAMSVQAPPNLSAEATGRCCGGHQRLGRGLAPHPGLHQPRGALARARPARGALRRRRLRPARAAHDLPRVPGRRPLPRPGHAPARPRAGRARRARRGRGAPPGGGGRVSVTFCRTAGPGPAARATVREGAGLDEAAIAAALAEGLLPVETARAGGPALAFVAGPADALALAGAGVGGWRITVRHEGPRAAVLDALVRSGAAFLRTDPARLEEAIELGWLPGTAVRVSVPVADLAEALDAIAAGAVDLVLGDWGPDEVAALRDALAPRALVERTALPPETEIDAARAELARPLFTAWLARVDGSGAARPRYRWAPGRDEAPPVPARRLSAEWEDPAWREGEPEAGLGRLAPDLAGILERSLEGRPPRVDEIERLFRARGPEVEAVAQVADRLRRERCGEVVTYVVNRNINYTNQCYFRCGFCGFSRGPKSLNLRGDPYILEVHEVVHRSVEAWERGATEVCLQGGIHPDFTGDFYAGVLEAIKARLPEMHVHGFTPLEVWQGAHTLGVSVREFLTRLRDAGLGTLPGTAAEILDDRVRLHLCPDKVRTAEWAEVMITAHELGLRATTTMMFGHIDGPRAWANHLEVLRRIQRRTGGFTEFVPLPFVHMASPIFLQGKARPGPTWDEVVLVHAVGRIALAGLIDNIQASWVKLGLDGGARLLAAGCNDLGGTLMDENISRASGASHGQLATPEELEAAIRSAGRIPARRNTVYELIGAPAP